MSARALKQTAWLFSPATLLLALLMVTFAHTAWILSGAHPDHLRVLLGNLIFFPICLLAAGLTFSLSRRLTGRPRRTWQLFTAGILSWGFGQVIYTALDLTGRPTFPSLADLGYLLLIPCFLAGLLFLPRARHSRLQSSACCWTWPSLSLRWVTSYGIAISRPCSMAMREMPSHC